MLFVFYILVFLDINYAEINCFALRQNELDGEINDTNTTKIPELIIPNNATTKHFFKMIKNLTSTKTLFSNLKSNVFDKMLSEEMLSIKEHLFEKDLSQVSLIISTNGNAPTPTLEIKQKWPLFEYDSVEDNNSKNKSIYHVTDNSHDEPKIEQAKTDSGYSKEENTSKKVVGLRSLSADRHPHATVLTNRSKITHRDKSKVSKLSKGVKLCTCSNINNPSVSCTHRSDSSCKCGFKDPKECTRLFQTNYPTAKLSVTVPIYTYITYPTYLVEISTLSPYRDYYYHPDVIDAIKLPKNRKKHKHRHTTKKIDEDSLYYDNSKEGFFKGYDDTDEVEHDLPNGNKLQSQEDDNKVIINIDYEIRDEKGQITKTTLSWENVHLEGVMKDKLVNDVVKDLRQQYADAVVKDCYCSAFFLQPDIQIYLLLLIVALFLF